MAKTPNKLNSFRILKGYSEQEVAALFGLKNKVAISRWEKGDRMPNGMQMLQLCVIYDASFEDLYPELHKKLAKEMNARQNELGKKNKPKKA